MSVLSVRSRASRRTGVVALLVAALALVGCMPAAASDVRIRHTLFGLHDKTAASDSLRTVDAGAVRLWDVGVRWYEVETHQNGHRYDWSRLDQLVSAAHRKHAAVTMVVAGTPSFYSPTPWNVPSSHVADYKAFVRALMKRYGRRIAAYQAWNEGNIKTFWTGTFAKLATLTRAMDRVRDRYAPQAKVIAPPMVTRLPFEMDGLARFYRQRAGGVPVWRHVDAVALSLYPAATYGARTGVPEDGIKLLDQARLRLHRVGVPGSKPIWDTEVNYGLGDGSATPISDGRQVANVMRTYLLNAAHGVKRVFWYRYDWGPLSDGGTLGNTLLTKPTDSSQVTAAGKAFRRIQRWMHGTLLGTNRARPCQKDRQGTYTCVVRDSSGTRRIYWNPFRTARVRLAGNAHHLTREFGGVTRVTPRSTITVRYRPVMAGA